MKGQHIHLWAVERTKEHWDAQTEALSVFSRREQTQSFSVCCQRHLFLWLVLEDPGRHTDMVVFLCISSTLEMQPIDNA